MNNELIFGNEPYLIGAYKQEVKKGLIMPEFNLRTAEQFSVEEQDFAMQSPFGGNRRVLIIEADKLTANEKLEKYLKNPAPQTDLYIFAKEVDKRLSLYKYFKGDSLKKYDKTDPDKLKRWILNYVSKRNCKITEQAYKELLDRVNYEMEDVSLYHIKGAMNRLCATQEEITLELVKRLVPANEKEDIFKLIRLIDEKKEEELFHQVDLIIRNQNQNIIGTLSLLLRNYRILYKINVCNCSLNDVGVHYKTYVPKLSKEQADEGIRIIQDCVNGIKGGRYLQEFALKLCMARLCQLKSK